MRGLYILAEGQTEEQFINEVLSHHFQIFGIFDVRAILMETSHGKRGGAVSYARLKQNVEKLLNRERDIIVTSFIDYYGLKTDFPNYVESRNYPTPEQRVEHLEYCLIEDIGNERFVPYIQLHEFEGLLFSSGKGFEILFPDLPTINKQELLEIIRKYPNPELINDRPDFAPSKRLERLIPNYKKPLFGGMIALENGIEGIIQKCPRFRNWIEKLIIKMED